MRCWESPLQRGSSGTGSCSWLSQRGGVSLHSQGCKGPPRTRTQVQWVLATTSFLYLCLSPFARFPSEEMHLTIFSDASKFLIWN